MQPVVLPGASPHYCGMQFGRAYRCRLAIAMAAVLIVKAAIGLLCASTVISPARTDADGLFTQIVVCTAHGPVSTPAPTENAPVSPDDPTRSGHCDACALVTGHVLAAATASSSQRLEPDRVIGSVPQVTDSPALRLRNSSTQSRAPPRAATA